MPGFPHTDVLRQPLFPGGGVDMGIINASTDSALRSTRLMNEQFRRIGKGLEKLATGLRINQASDDPSGMVVANQLRAQILGTRKAIENLNTGTHIERSAESVAGQIGDMIRSIRTLVVAGLNEQFTPGARDAQQKDIDRLLDGIDRLVDTTRFGDDDRLLDGTKSKKSFFLSNPTQTNAQDIGVPT